MKPRHARGLAAVWSACTIASLAADTLVLKDGRRMEGQLIAVRDGVIEFDGRRAQGGRERVTIDRVDVVRIELDDVESHGKAPTSRPAGMRERNVMVDATVAWTDTGVDVHAGQMIYFSATDRIRWAPGRRDGPEGEHNSPPNAARPLPGERRGALVGRVGDSRDYFLVGADKGPIGMRSSGRLYLGVNDESLQDNAGSFRVTVYF